MYIFVIRKSNDVLFHDIFFPVKFYVRKHDAALIHVTCMYLNIRQEVTNEIILIEKNYFHMVVLKKYVFNVIDQLIARKFSLDKNLKYNFNNIPYLNNRIKFIELLKYVILNF